MWRSVPDRWGQRSSGHEMGWRRAERWWTTGDRWGCTGEEVCRWWAESRKSARSAGRWETRLREAGRWRTRRWGA